MARFGLWEYPDALDRSRRCSFCHNHVERSGRLCRSCSRKLVMKVVVGVLAVTDGAAAVAYVTSQPAQKPLVVAVPAADLAAERAAARLPPPAAAKGAPTGWLYYDTADSLVGDVTHHARLISNAPFSRDGVSRDGARVDGAGVDGASMDGAKALEGASAGTLELADSRRYGKSVVLTLPAGRNGCQANACTLRASFDGGKTEAYPFEDLSDEQHRILAIGDYQRFTGKLSHAHDLVIVASLGLPQDVVVSFTVAGFRLAMAPMRHYASVTVSPGRGPRPPAGRQYPG